MLRTLVSAAVMAAVAVAVVPPSAAGGPTSALLSVPGEGTTASLYYTDPEYDALAALVGLNPSDHVGLGNVDDSGRSHENGPGITVTWLIHDVMPWRVDHIYLEGPGAPWIATQTSVDDGDLWDRPAVWHQPAAPVKLAQLLDELGVAKVAREAGTFTGVAGQPVDPPSDPADEPEGDVPAAATGSEPQAQNAVPAGSAAAGRGLSALWWGLGGLGLGILGTAFWTRRRNRTTTSMDAVNSPDHVPDDPEPGARVAEELAWPPARV